MSKSLKKQLISGVFYTAIAKYAGVIVTFLISVVLARLLPPEDFGVVAISTVFITFFAILSDFGIGPAIIQHKKLTKEDLSNIYSFTIYCGIALSLIFFSFSWLAAWYYEKRILVSIFQILSINVFFASADIVPNSLLLREKKFKFIAYRTLLLRLLSGTLAVLSAYLGLGVYSLLVSPIITSVGVFIMNYAKMPQSFNWKINISSLKTIFSFSSYTFLYNFINYFSRNLDKLLIGKFIGLPSLGYYDVSYKLMMLPLQNITYVVSPVMQPVLSDYQNDYVKLSSSYLKIIRLLSFIGFPLSVLLFFASREIVLITFGEQWVKAIPIFEILTLSVGIQVVLSTAGSIFLVSNKPKVYFIWGLISAIINISGLFIALIVFKSLAAVSWALVTTFFINFIICYWIMFCRIFKIGMFVFVKELISPLVIALIIGISLFLLNKQLYDFNMIFSLLIKGAIYLILLGGYIFIRKEYDIKRLFLEMRGK